MKRKICMTAVIVSMVLLSACGKQNTETTDKTTPETTPETNILKEIDAANDEDALIKKYGRIAYTATYYRGDGTSEEVYLYQDETKFVAKSKEYIEYDEDGELYGMRLDNEVPYKYMFIGDGYEQYRESEENTSGYAYMGVEKVESCEEKDGILVVTEIVDDQEVVDDLAAGSLYESPGTFTKCKNVCEVDAENYEIININSYLITKDGEEVYFGNNTREENPEEIPADENLKEKINQGDQRTVTVIADNGTENEKTYSQTVCKGCRVYIYLDRNMDLTFYKDPEYKTILQGNSDATIDQTIYVKSE